VTFEVEEGAIRYALAALKGVGAQAVEAIVAARTAGPFRDLADFAARINPRAVNKRVLESLACAGAFDEIEPDRARAHAGVDAMLGFAQRRHEASSVGQNELFGGGTVRETLPIPPVASWLPGEKLGHEYDAVGFFLSGHPLDDYAAVLKKLKVATYAEFSRQVRDGATAGRVAATVVSRAERRTKTGNRMGILGLSDPTGHYEAVIFAEGLAQYRDVLEPGAAVLLFLTAEANGDEVRARIATAEPLDAAAEKTSQSLRVFLRDATSIESIARRLEPAGGRGALRSAGGTAQLGAGEGMQMASRNGGNGRNGGRPGNGGGAHTGVGTAGASDGEVNLILLLDMGEVEIKLPGRFKVSPQIAGAIKAVPGVETVEAV
jgi:DNA polymerase-3 subunit alpha